MANEEPMLHMHTLRPAPGAKKDRIRVGRGEGSKGKTSGRGDKGTKKRYPVSYTHLTLPTSDLV